ncbi:hypothetical protein DFQ28_008390 [Apophysomyces sp. BC1034]|nr:hypothetical protein DFQ30_007923 [Apophysomyces sp. BC1015]KAG0181886.1 hypothetical protein DFQ29_006680 [Apophysomyces sp. BC1021]KAG0192641.1 hypothetical protein DFQ28_008390 [Apophysomyces sp. BC1034]
MILYGIVLAYMTVALIRPLQTVSMTTRLIELMTVETKTPLGRVGSLVVLFARFIVLLSIIFALALVEDISLLRRWLKSDAHAKSVSTKPVEEKILIIGPPTPPADDIQCTVPVPAAAAEEAAKKEEENNKEEEKAMWAQPPVVDDHTTLSAEMNRLTDEMTKESKDVDHEEKEQSNADSTNIPGPKISQYLTAPITIKKDEDQSCVDRAPNSSPHIDTDLPAIVEDMDASYTPSIEDDHSGSNDIFESGHSPATLETHILSKDTLPDLDFVSPVNGDNTTPEPSEQQQQQQQIAAKEELPVTVINEEDRCPQPTSSNATIPKRNEETLYAEESPAADYKNIAAEAHRSLPDDHEQNLVEPVRETLEDSDKEKQYQHAYPNGAENHQNHHTNTISTPPPSHFMLDSIGDPAFSTSLSEFPPPPSAEEEDTPPPTNRSSFKSSRRSSSTIHDDISRRGSRLLQKLSRKSHESLKASRSKSNSSRYPESVVSSTTSPTTPPPPPPPPSASLPNAPKRSVSSKVSSRLKKSGNRLTKLFRKS